MFLTLMRDHLICDHTEVFSSSNKFSFREVLFHCLSMQRFVSKQSSSSVDLASLSVDDVRAVRAAIALFLGLSCPPAWHAKPLNRPCMQQCWHNFHHHEITHGVHFQRPGWRRLRDAIVRPPTREELACTSTPSAAPTAAPIEDEPSGSTAKRRKVHVDPTVRDWFFDMSHQWKTERWWDVQSRVVRRDRCEHSFYSWKRSHQQHLSAGRLCCHPQT